MTPIARLLALAALVLLLAPSATAATATGTSSTGNVDTYGIPNPLAGVRDCNVLKLDLGCLAETCTDDIYIFTVRLTLLDASPGDAVAISQAGDPPGFGSATTPLTAVPVAVATFDDPTAEMTVRLGGCNRGTTVAVVGLLVEGEVSYTLSY